MEYGLSSKNLFSRAERSFLGNWWWTIDRPLLSATLALMLLGIAMVMAASPAVAERINVDSMHFVLRHLVFLVIAFILLIGCSMLSVQQVWRIGTLAMIGGIVALLAVLAIGIEIKGAQRWISLGPLSLQPSEFIKPAFAITAGWFLAMQKEKQAFPGWLLSISLYAGTVFLLMMQPDFGMTIVLTCIFGSQVVLAGIPLRWGIGLLAICVLLAAIVYMSFPHVQSRIDRFINPEAGDNYQVEKSLEAFRSGGILGVGPGQGTVKQSIPDVHADFIFSVVGEELGFIAIILLMGIYLFVILRAIKKLIASQNLFTMLATGGLLVQFGLQALIHMGSALNILPAKGMTLPFISYGGSSLMATAFTMGLILALTRKQGRRGIAKGGLSA